MNTIIGNGQDDSSSNPEQVFCISHWANNHQKYIHPISCANKRQGKLGSLALVGHTI